MGSEQVAGGDDERSVAAPPPAAPPSRTRLKLASWLFWGAWMLFGLAFELFAVYTEKKHGTEPLTRVVRDRLMRKSVIARLGVLLFLSWLCLHFFVGGATPVAW